MMALKRNYMIDINHITNYIHSLKISILLSKYNNICVSTKQVFMNYKQIMVLLWVANDIPKHVKLNIISLLVQKN